MVLNPDLKTLGLPALILVFVDSSLIVSVVLLSVGSETHFKVIVISDSFQDKSLIQVIFQLVIYHPIPSLQKC